ncbi:hypothetical protein KWH75_06440 [Morganella morganii]|uniref:hypothetical protein n=1 Tax=Morganella morganii TaxID=582 RepID=UPI0021D27661|nr:hypothetical protein [Morganella morganii]MCU6236705.1 hypothetical protein [Morganella morganii]
MRLQYQPPEDWRDFERLCKVIFAKKFQIQELSLYGRQGSKQNGVDLFGRYRHWYSALGVQCKLKQNYPMKCITVKEVADEINKAKEFKPELSHYIVATTAPRNIQVQDYLHNEVASDDTLRFSVDVCFWDDIQDYLNDFPDVANRFYNNKENSELFFLEPFYKSIGLNDESDVFYYYESDQGEIYLTGKHDDLTIYVKKDSIFINFNKECRFNLRMVNGCTKKIGHIYIDIFSLTDFLGGFVHG